MYAAAGPGVPPKLLSMSIPPPWVSLPSAWLLLMLVS
jgi:hypothetical protein